MALRLSLKPHERVIIGGTVLRNSDSRTELLVENEVPILREADILSPGAAVTPCQRIYLALQLTYVDAEDETRHLALYRQLVAEVMEAAPSCRPLIERMEDHVAGQRYYQALKCAGQLLDYESELMSHVR